MKSSRAPWAISLALFLAWAVQSPLIAQGTSAQDDTVYEDEYDQGEYSAKRFGLGLGAGIVLPNDEGNEDGEIYFSANFRWRIFDRGEDSNGRDTTRGDAYNERHNRSHDRGRYPGTATDSGIRGYIEPEIGYWSRSDDDSDVDDLMVGINLVGVVPTRSADFFVGVGFALHQISGDIVRRNGGGVVIDNLELDDDRLGANVHVGVELHLTENVGIFGTGRLDILEDEPFDRQTKIWGGIRFHF